MVQIVELKSHCSCPAIRKKGEHAENQQLLLDLWKNWGHRATTAPKTGERGGYQESQFTRNKIQKKVTGITTGETKTRTLKEILDSDT